ncbi:MAG: hypothetical protein IJ527_03290 [Prevotella sp.]|nr:hypothetical protein [Prevotella sp.]
MAVSVEPVKLAPVTAIFFVTSTPFSVAAIVASVAEIEGKSAVDVLIAVSSISLVPLMRMMLFAALVKSTNV